MPRAYGVSQGWISRIVAGYRAEGEATFEPPVEAAEISPAAIPAEKAELIVRLRKELAGAGVWTSAHIPSPGTSAITVR